MPIYEYECDKCGHRFEKIQKFSDPPLDTCPKCGGGVHKMQSAPAFQFKGTGWYVTDYGKSGKADAGDSKPAAEPAKPESAKTETTPAKSEPKSAG
jgi:putative FmdB family regulatory protein